jgi:hypothetical protein
MPLPRFTTAGLLGCAGWLLSVAVTAAPQNEFDREASAREYVQFLVLQLDQWTRSFPRDYNAALMRPPVDAGKLSEAARSGAGDLHDSITRLGTLSSARDVLTNAEFRALVAKAVATAEQVNQAMGTRRFPAPLQSDWDQVRASLNNLARIYKVDTLAVLEPPGASRGGRGPQKTAAAPPVGGLSGYIVDQQCAARGKGMWINAACVARCIREGDKVVLVTEEGKVFQITNPDKIDTDAYGQKVTIAGKTNEQSIAVESLQIQP